MSQTAYQQDPNIAVEGMLADASFDKDIVTGIANEPISFGLAVSRVDGGPADDRPPRVALPDNIAAVTSGQFMGLALNDPTKEQAATPIGYATDDSIRILRAGRGFVLSETIAVLGDPVFVRISGGGGGSQLGAWRSDSDAGTAEQVHGASWRSATSALAQLAIVELHGVIA